MSIESEIYDRLAGFAGLSALVSTRIYPNVMPHTADMPAVSFRRVSADRTSAMSVDTGNVHARFQFDCWARTTGGASGYDSVRDVADQVRQALQRWTNSSGTVVEDSFLVSDVDLYEDETKIHHVALDFEIHYRE